MDDEMMVRLNDYREQTRQEVEFSHEETEAWLTTQPFKGLTVTPSQKTKIAYLRRHILRHDGLGWPHIQKYEYKSFTLTQHGAFISLSSDVGRKGDEGTAAAIFARTHRHIFIGKRGGLQLANAKLKSQSKGDWNVINRLVEGY